MEVTKYFVNGYFLITLTGKIDLGYGMVITEVVGIVFIGLAFVDLAVLKVLFLQGMRCSSDSGRIVVLLLVGLKYGLNMVR